MTDTPITKMLTSAEACEQLNIDRSTLSRWVKSGRIETAHKFPGKRGGFLFTVDQVDAAKPKPKPYTPHPGDPYVDEPVDR